MASNSRSIDGSLSRREAEILLKSDKFTDDHRKTFDTFFQDYNILLGGKMIAENVLPQSLWIYLLKRKELNKMFTSNDFKNFDQHNTPLYNTVEANVKIARDRFNINQSMHRAIVWLGQQHDMFSNLELNERNYELLSLTKRSRHIYLKKYIPDSEFWKSSQKEIDNIRCILENTKKNIKTDESLKLNQYIDNLTLDKNKFRVYLPRQDKNKIYDYIMKYG